MDLTKSVAFSPDALASDVGYVETSYDVGMGAIGANEVSNVQVTVVETVGMTSVDVVAISLCFNWIKVPNYFSVSLN